ncbi:MAG: oligosaccharide flippase family protein [Parahaliea sp.]
MSFRVLATNAVWSGLARLLGRGGFVVASMIFARNLSTRDFAAYSYFQLTVTLLATYSAMGLGMTASRLFAQVNYVDDEKLPPIATLWFLSLGLGLLVAVAIALLPPGWLDKSLGLEGWMMGLGTFVLVAGVIPGGGVLGMEQYRVVAIFSALSAAFLIVGALVLGSSATVFSATLVFVLSALIQTLGSSLVVFRKMSWKRFLATASFGRDTFESLYGLVGPMVVVSLLAASGSWLVGRIILSGEFGEYQFALYAIGLQWYSLVLFIPGMISRVLLPRFVRGRLSPDSSANEEMARMIRWGVALASVAALAVSATGLVLSPWLLSFYGEEYMVNAWLLFAFMLAAMPTAPANTFGNAIIADNGQWSWMVVTMLCLACMVVVAVVFLDEGAMGGALAHGLAALLMTALAYYVARKRQLV